MNEGEAKMPALGPPEDPLLAALNTLHERIEQVRYPGPAWSAPPPAAPRNRTWRVAAFSAGGLAAAAAIIALVVLARSTTPEHFAPVAKLPAVASSASPTAAPRAAGAEGAWSWSPPLDIDALVPPAPHIPVASAQGLSPTGVPTAAPVAVRLPVADFHMPTLNN